MTFSLPPADSRIRPRSLSRFAPKGPVIRAVEPDVFGEGSWNEMKRREVVEGGAHHAGIPDRTDRDVIEPTVSDNLERPEWLMRIAELDALVPPGGTVDVQTARIRPIEHVPPDGRASDETLTGRQSMPPSTAGKTAQKPPARVRIRSPRPSPSMAIQDYLERRRGGNG